MRDTTVLIEFTLAKPNLLRALALQTRKLLSHVGITTLTLILITGCEWLPKSSIEETQQPTTAPEQAESLPSAAPIVMAQENEIRFAQTTLNTLGYKLGIVDGIWGPRSAKAIREFERAYGLESAKGLLSELNLFMLEKISNTSRTSIAQISGEKTRPKLGISAKLDNQTALDQAPQLVFTDRPYAVLAKPNPFSEQLALLPIGTGIYILSLQEGWFEVESENKEYGFIKAD
jgi:hypothetical protein